MLQRKTTLGVHKFRSPLVPISNRLMFKKKKDKKKKKKKIEMIILFDNNMK